VAIGQLHRAGEPEASAAKLPPATQPDYIGLDRWPPPENRPDLARRAGLGDDGSPAAPAAVPPEPPRGKKNLEMLPDAETFKRLVDGSVRGPGPAAARLAGIEPQSAR
jgi:hypothetical protein